MAHDEMGDRIAALEHRIRVLEDTLAVQQVMNSWGPAVDTGDSDTASRLFVEDGYIDSNDRSRMDGRAGIVEMIEGPGHQGLIRQGCAHIQGFPVIRVDGDEASATGYSRVYLHTDGGYEIFRCSANHWRFRRTDQGWRVTSRENHVVDGRPEARAILARAFDADR